MSLIWLAMRIIFTVEIILVYNLVYDVMPRGK